MPSEDDIVRGMLERSWCSEAEIRESLKQSKLHKENRANHGRYLESVADSNLDLLRQAVIAYSEAGLYDDKNRMVKRILKIAPDDPRAIYENTKHLSGTLRKQGLVKENLELLLAEYLRLYNYPEYTEAADRSIEYILFECEEYERAIPYLQRLFEINPAVYANRYTECLYKVGRYVEALKAFRVVSFMHYSEESQERYAHVLEIAGRARDARRLRHHIEHSRILQEIIERQPPQPELARRRLQLPRPESEVLDALYNPKFEKLGFERARDKLNGNPERRYDRRTFTADDVKQIEQSALEHLALTEEEYRRINIEYLNSVEPFIKENELRQRKLLEEKYPDLLDPQETDNLEDEEDQLW